jgi:hypothetical protein
VFLDATLVGIWMVISALVPALAPRPFPRWLSVASGVVLVSLPLVAAVLGFLEGRLKAS